MNRLPNANQKAGEMVSSRKHWLHVTESKFNKMAISHNMPGAGATLSATTGGRYHFAQGGDLKVPSTARGQDLGGPVCEWHALNSGHGLKKLQHSAHHSVIGGVGCHVSGQLSDKTTTRAHLQIHFAARKNDAVVFGNQASHQR